MANIIMADATVPLPSENGMLGIGRCQQEDVVDPDRTIVERARH